MSKVETGNVINVHYVGVLNDGTEFDNSRTRGEVLSFTVGSGQMIPGFDNAVVGMEIGEVKNVILSADEAYGQRAEEAITEVAKSQFPEDFDFIEGATVYGQSEDGNPIMAKIIESKEDEVTIDFNHPLAGEVLNFEIELVEIN